jgi:hypothetical protein
MTKTLLTIFISLFFFNLLFADAEIMEFRAEPAQNKTTISWKTGQEENVTKFHVERSTNNKDFTKVGEVDAKGSNSEYEFEDESISRMKNIYYYRLKVINNDGTFQFSESLPVIPNISSIKKTWGSIKALFR